MTDIIAEIEKAIDEYAHDKIEAAGIKAGAQFILPLLKKCLEQRNALLAYDEPTEQGMIMLGNNEMLKLLGENHE